jgi:serine/threonine protein kinase
MAIVYQARNTGTGKACALKIVHPHLVSRPELIEMFVREAQVAGRIGESPYVVNVFDAGVDDRLGVPFMAMELLKGETLDQYVEQRGPMAKSMVRTLFDQLADALDQAHRTGVIHRDLKPSNLFITYDRRGRPVLKIMDFGIAKVLEQGAQRTATRIGSPAYAAPEQQASAAFRRLAAKHGVVIAQGVSAATDVWAMGLVAYELLTGLPKGHYWATLESLDDILIKVAMEENESATDRAGERASHLPPGFDEWFARCLKKNAAERWQTPGEASAALRRLLAPSEIEVESTQPLSDDYRIPSRRSRQDPTELTPSQSRSSSPSGPPSPYARSAELAGPESDTEPAPRGSSSDAFTPAFRTRPSSASKTPSTPKPDLGAVQTRGTWTRTNAWPRRSKVALIIGASTFVVGALVFLLHTPPIEPISTSAPSDASAFVPEILSAAPTQAPTIAVSEPAPVPAATVTAIASPVEPPATSATPRSKRTKKSPWGVPYKSRIVDAGAPDAPAADSAPEPTAQPTSTSPPPFEAPPP